MRPALSPRPQEQGVRRRPQVMQVNPSSWQRLGEGRHACRCVNSRTALEHRARHSANRQGNSGPRTVGLLPASQERVAQEIVGQFSGRSTSANLLWRDPQVEHAEDDDRSAQGRSRRLPLPSHFSPDLAGSFDGRRWFSPLIPRLPSPTPAWACGRRIRRRRFVPRGRGRVGPW
jgi:hypothetical protein